MSAHQMLFMRETSATYSVTFVQTGADHYYYGDGCGTSINGYIAPPSGSAQGSISPTTFRGGTITQIAEFGNSGPQNDSQNQDPNEWYCSTPSYETYVSISGQTDQNAFSQIRFFDSSNTYLGALTSASAFSFSSGGTWTWENASIPTNATKMIIDY